MLHAAGTPTVLHSAPGGGAPGARCCLHRQQRRARLQVVEVPHHMEACAKMIGAEISGGQPLSPCSRRSIFTTFSLQGAAAGQRGWGAAQQSIRQAIAAGAGKQLRSLGVAAPFPSNFWQRDATEVMNWAQSIATSGAFWGCEKHTCERVEGGAGGCGLRRAQGAGRHRARPARAGINDSARQRLARLPVRPATMHRDATCSLMVNWTVLNNSRIGVDDGARQCLARCPVRPVEQQMTVLGTVELPEIFKNILRWR